MASAVGFPPLPGDPGDPGGPGGGGPTNFFDGSYAGQRLPWYMDKNGTSGAIQVLRMQAVKGMLPEDPFLLRLSVEKCIGAPIDGAISEGKGSTYALKVRGTKQVEKLLKMTTLLDGTKIKIVEHPTLNTSRCIVNCSAVIKLSDDVLKDYLSTQGVIDLRRITRLVGKKRENTATMILSFSGTVIPESVEFGWQRCKTKPYYPAPMQCFNCWSFGHTRLRCLQVQTCGTCAQSHPIDTEVACEADIWCSRCNNNSHPLSSRKCPAYIKENEVQRIRVDQGCSYPTAKRMYEQTHSSKSFAAVTVAGKDQQIAELLARVDNLLKELEKKDKRIEALELAAVQGNSTADNSLLETLTKKVDVLSNELKKKDRQIQDLESILNPNSRLDSVKKHGTIEDLLAKNSTLEATLSNKNHEIKTLRNIMDSLRSQKPPTPALPVDKLVYDVQDTEEASETQQSTERTAHMCSSVSDTEMDLNPPAASAALPRRNKSKRRDHQEGDREKSVKRSHNPSDSDESVQHIPKVIITSGIVQKK